MTVALTYDVCAKGWATVELAIGDNRASFQVIYLTEPLRDLLDSAAAIISGDYSTLEVKFQDEPGEHRMQFGARGERLHVAIFRIEETFSRLQSNRGEEVLSAEWAQNVWRRCFVSGAAGPRRYRRGPAAPLTKQRRQTF